MIRCLLFKPFARVHILREVRHLLKESKLLITTRPDISVSFIKMQANKVGHLLVRVLGCFNDFFNPSYLVLEHIMYDAFMI